MKRLDPNIYNNKIEEILKSLVEDLKTIIKSRGGKLEIYDNGNNRLAIGSFKDAVVDNIYIDNNQVMIECSYWVKYQIPMDCDFKTYHFNVGQMSYYDYLDIYKIVVDIINKKK